MELEIYQWLVPLISIFFLVRTSLQYSRKKRTVTSTIIWLIFWIVVMILALVPSEIAENIAELLGFKSQPNAIIFVALGFIFLFIFYLSSSIERLEMRITELIRKQAIDSKALADKQAELKEIKKEMDLS